MSDSAHVAARGTWGTVEWAIASNGKMPALEFYQETLSNSDKAKADTLFKRLAETGRIVNPEKFKNLGERAGPEGRKLYEFKSFQIRFLGAFRPGGRFVIAIGVRKKKDNLSKSGIKRALQILAQHDARERSPQ